MDVLGRCTESEDGLHCTHWWHDGGPCHFCGADGRDGIVRERDALRDQLRGAVSLSAEELHCLICAMAGNFPEQFKPIRMDLLRKLAKAQRAAGGQ